MTREGTKEVIWDLFDKAKDAAEVKYTQDLSGYPAWKQALITLGASHGVHAEFKDGSSIGYVGDLIDHGVDPDHIVAIATLVFSS